MKKNFSLVLVVLAIALSLAGCKSDDYEKAVELQDAGEYQSALEIFTELGDYEDSQDRMASCQEEIDNSDTYETALSYLSENNYESAAELFESLGEYKDAKERLEECETALVAIETYKEAKAGFDQKVKELDDVIAECDLLIADSATALDESLLPALETSVSTARSAKTDYPDLPEKIEEVDSLVTEMNQVDYSAQIADMVNCKEAYEKSVKQYLLVSAPSEGYVISCLKNVPNIIDISAVTEENDPNGMLNKSGGYTAQIFFSSDLIDQGSIYGASVIEKGTACGGSIEVYSTPEEALKREEYLASYDGSILSTGSHAVVGTVLVRTSDELTASQQKELETNIISALTFLE